MTTQTNNAAPTGQPTSQAPITGANAPPVRAALYLRVSTDSQTVENQRRELLELAAAKGYAIAAEYADEGVSGAKGRKARPAFDRLLTDAALPSTERPFDVILAWSVDRLGRSLIDLVTFLKDVHQAGVGLVVLRQALDSTTPSGKAMFQMMGVFAEFERSMIVERVHSGLDRARAAGTRLGNPPLPAHTRDAVLADLLKPTRGPTSAIAARNHCSVSAVYKVAREHGVPTRRPAVAPTVAEGRAARVAAKKAARADLKTNLKGKEVREAQKLKEEAARRAKVQRSHQSGGMVA